jgi:hypothetical protein
VRGKRQARRGRSARFGYHAHAAIRSRPLQRARKIESDETETLSFQSYDTTNGVERIEIWAADRRTVAEWESEFVPTGRDIRTFRAKLD